MAYPQNGSMANGSRRRSPTVPSAAAVCSEEMVAPMKTPCAQDSASVTRGTLVALRPPKRIASVSYTHLRAHETDSYLVCRLLLEKKKQDQTESNIIYTH